MGSDGFLPVVVVHGGAWNIPDHLRELSLEGVQHAAEAAVASLRRDPSSALDAVEAAVRVLEDDPVFDAGIGSCLTEDRDVEMDSIIMCGQTLNTGAVAAVKNIQHPITLARMVMEKTPHALLVAHGANKFAKEMGMQTLPLESLVSKEAIDDWENKYRSVVKSNFAGHDTVGCIVLTRDGNMACATSTGGISHKRAGRVGDSPLIGCGAYSDNDIGTASTTGHGESIMKVTLARRALFFLEQGRDVQDAASEALREMDMKTKGGKGGLIMIATDGSVAHEFTTPRMPWAVVRSNGRISIGIDTNAEERTVDV